MTQFEGFPRILEAEVTYIVSAWVRDYHTINKIAKVQSAESLVEQLAEKELYFDNTYESMSQCVHWIMEHLSKLHLVVFCHLLTQQLSERPNNRVMRASTTQQTP